MTDYNLYAKSRAEQDAASADTLACYWLYRLRAGEMTRPEIEKRLREMTPEQQQLHRDALNRNKHKFKVPSGK
ncbi:hypothetical protein AAY72_01630 [Alishewanella sp. WH16-1]|uniref:hypothetical protein n=1 Tax=Alishewanella sp. WH16-1 TaxID=1651088 RepID=UPI00071008CC|nr:hypothetical protein [Alishewanella sp. WH16-1]KRS22840.1 hypothetical protein AAY72_01630 [Alishewanella sp. WH16-1]